MNSPLSKFQQTYFNSTRSPYVLQNLLRDSAHVMICIGTLKSKGKTLLSESQWRTQSLLINTLDNIKLICSTVVSYFDKAYCNIPTKVLFDSDEHFSNYPIHTLQEADLEFLRG